MLPLREQILNGVVGFLEMAVIVGRVFATGMRRNHCFGAHTCDGLPDWGTIVGAVAERITRFHTHEGADGVAALMRVPGG